MQRHIKILCSSMRSTMKYGSVYLPICALAQIMACNREYKNSLRLKDAINYCSITFNPSRMGFCLYRQQITAREDYMSPVVFIIHASLPSDSSTSEEGSEDAVGTRRVDSLILRCEQQDPEMAEHQSWEIISGFYTIERDSSFDPQPIAS
jgi:hypothetical protein